MRRFGMVIKVKPDKLEYYKQLHSSAWPEVVATIKACNIQNYSIFHKDDYLFSYFEYTGDDFDEDMNKMGQDPITQKWWDICKPCHEPLPTRNEGEWWADMQEIFYCK
jgi:L-rhamnose mutarotase